MTGGEDPFGRLLMDAAGDFYGTTLLGGQGCGVVYGLRNVSSVWNESVLHTFGTLRNDGCAPEGGGMVFDSAGNLYGTTAIGGGSGCNDGGGCGTIFLVSRKPGTRTESVVHRFGSGIEGASPGAALVFDSKGNAYGTTGAGGPCDCGVVFKMSPTSKGGWVYSVLHTFSNTDGALPVADLILDGSGNLYGTTWLGGSGGNGVTFEITP